MRFFSLTNHRLPWYERYGGFCIAVPAVSLALVMLTWVRPDVPAPPRPPEPMRVLIELPEEPPPIEELQDQVPPEPEELVEEEMLDPVPPEIAATRVDSDETGEELVDPIVGQNASDAPFAHQAVERALADWMPTQEEAAELRALRDAMRREAEQLDTRRKELQSLVVREEVKSAARNFAINSDGGLRGAIRLLETAGWPDEVVRPILDRYGMTFERRYTEPVAGHSFLNAAQTGQGTFAAGGRAGYYDVLTLSNKALAYMASREAEALMKKGFDPRTTRVLRITFGIVKTSGPNSNDYDLGVTDLEVEQIN